MSSFVRAAAIRWDEPVVSREAKRKVKVCGCTAATFERCQPTNTTVAVHVHTETTAHLQFLQLPQQGGRHIKRVSAFKG